MRNATEMKELIEKVEIQSKKFVDTTIEKYGEIFEKDLISHGKFVIDLTHTSENSAYRDDPFLHPISIGQYNVTIVGRLFEQVFKGMGYNPYYNLDGAVIVSLKH